MWCGDNRAASHGGPSPMCLPRRWRWGKLIKLATRSPNWVGCPARPKVTHFAAVLRGRTPANTPKVFALSGCRRVADMVDSVMRFVILKLQI
ncbi:MAG: hypothetical protein K8L91_21990 [Anaerolineae bacterium]|nr:hypothetical protein [Anaerolineae bacterium]